jgi:hypothetical protein
MTQTAAALPKCPNCNSVIPPTKTKCVSCGMEVSVMESYRKAKAAAEGRPRGNGGSKGNATASSRMGWERVEEKEAPPAWKKPVKIGGAVLAGILLVWGGVVLIGVIFGKGESWRGLPTDPQAAVAQYLRLVCEDDTPNNASHTKAYEMIAAKFKNPDDKGEGDLFLAYHHKLYKYLVCLTEDEHWDKSAKVEADPKAADKFKVTVGVEVLTVQVVDASPADVAAKGEHHWAVSGFLEIDPHLAAGANIVEGAIGFSKLYGAGPGFAQQLRGIAAMGGHAKTPLWAAKFELLPVIADPYITGMDAHIIDLYPHRLDPAVRFCLQRLVDDGRYSPSARERAKKVMDGTLDMDVEGAARGLE